MRMIVAAVLCLALSSVHAAAPQPGSSRSGVSVQFSKDGRISVRAQQTRLRDLLDTLAKRYGFTFSGPQESLDALVSLELKNLSLAEALSAILRDYNFAIFEDDRNRQIREISVLSAKNASKDTRPEPAAASEPEPAAPPIAEAPYEAPPTADAAAYTNEAPATPPLQPEVNGTTQADGPAVPVFGANGTVNHAPRGTLPPFTASSGQAAVPPSNPAAKPLPAFVPIQSQTGPPLTGNTLPLPPFTPVRNSTGPAPATQ